MKFRHDINGLRAIAVMLVVLYHAGFPPIGGFVGVDVFFVISGYLITKSIWDAKDAGTWSLLNFYDHRIRRILPGLIAMLAGTTLFALLCMLPNDLRQYSKTLIATAGFAANVELSMNASYFAKASEENLLLHTWSLGVEEQFYIFFPLFTALISGLGKRLRYACLVVVFLCSLLLCIALFPHYPTETFYNLPTRAWELMAGALISNSAFRLRRGATAQLVEIAGLALIFGSAFMLTPAMPFPGLLAVPLILGTAMVVLAGGEGLFGRLCQFAPIRWTGLISYSLYLWHWPLLAGARYILVRPLAHEERIALVIAGFVLAGLSYRFVEQPFRTRKPGTTIARGPIAGFASLSLIVIIGLGFLVAKGIPQRLPARAIALSKFAEDRPNENCTGRTAAQIAQGDLCAIGDTSKKPTYFLWGDSHAWALQNAYDIALRKRGVSALILPELGCPPLIGYIRTTSQLCAASTSAAMQWIESHRPEAVILVSGWTNWFNGHADFARPGAFQHSEETSRAALQHAFDLTLNRLKADHIPVWIMDPLPQAHFNVPDTLAKMEYLPVDAQLPYTRPEFAKRAEQYSLAMARSGALVSKRMRIWPYFCTDATCAIVENGRPLYSDDNHLALSQSEFFADILGREMR